MKKNVLLLWVLFFVVLFVPDAFADIFDDLAKKAKFVGTGFGKTGYLVAGFGLIVFSFMAIFNKISWKNLAYIMLSTFILSVMTFIVSEMSDGAVSESLSFSGEGSAVSGTSGDATKVPANRGS
ncbi:MAG: hypothetical protein IJ218_06820 [Alphaproteobacteria bacterium]|nr:hypothetical protein [Alphaproteobacteria bacterium]